MPAEIGRALASHAVTLCKAVLKALKLKSETPNPETPKPKPHIQSEAPRVLDLVLSVPRGPIAGQCQGQGSPKADLSSFRHQGGGGSLPLEA